MTEGLKQLEFPLQVQEAKDGFEAGKKISNFQPHLVILDVILPGLDGIQVCRDIRHDPETAHTPVIMVTGYDDPKIRETLKKLHVQGTFLKPVRINQLLDSIRHCLNRNGKKGVAK